MSSIIDGEEGRTKERREIWKRRGERKSWRETGREGSERGFVARTEVRTEGAEGRCTMSGREREREREHEGRKRERWVRRAPRPSRAEEGCEGRLGDDAAHRVLLGKERKKKNRAVRQSKATADSRPEARDPTGLSPSARVDAATRGGEEGEE